MTMVREPAGQTLVDKYRASYEIADEVELTEEMVLRHWELETRLRAELLDASEDERWEVFERSYDSLYRELPWLTNSARECQPDDALHHELWKDILGTPPLEIYEIGSGRGDLITYLAMSGFRCTATEITRERGARWVDESENLRWSQSDGVHLDQFDAIDRYDAVLSNQVVEHLHPDDVVTHFRGARRLLKSGGRYIFTTPHKSLGPSDVSRVFGEPTPRGMHLREYTYQEIVVALQRAGFSRIEAVFRPPSRVRSLLGSFSPIKASRVYLRYLLAIERTGIVERVIQRRPGCRWLSKLVLFPIDIMLVATNVAERLPIA